MNGEYLDISTNEVELTDEERKKAYMKEWREKHREHIRAYNKQHHIQIRQEASDIYYVVSELRALKRLQEQENKDLMNTIADYMTTIREENQSLKKYVNELLKEADQLKQNESIGVETERTPTESPVPQIYEPPLVMPAQVQQPVIPEILEVKKIKKIRKVKVKQPASPTFSVTSVESYTTPSKFSKNLINEVLDDLIDSDGNVIMSESD